MTSQEGFLRLSASTLEWLLETGHLDILGVSPLRVRPKGGKATSPKGRAAIAAEELGARGLSTGDGISAGAEGAAYREALEVAARPEAVIRIRMASRGEDPSTIGVIVDATRAATLMVEDDALLLGPAKGLESLAETLTQEASAAQSLRGNQIVLWPSVLQLLTMIWGSDKRATEPVRRDEAEARLTAKGIPGDRARPALAELEATGVLTASGKDVQIVVDYRPWLERAFSGHILQIERVPLEGSPSFEAALATDGSRVVFVGPPGDRILSDTVTGPALARWLQGRKASEDSAVRLCALPQEALGRVVRMLLGLEKVAAPA